MEANVGIIAACIPTLKPLLDPSTRHPWPGRGWSRKVTTDPSYRRISASRHHLNKQIDHANLPRLPPESARNAYWHDTNLVEISGGREDPTSEESDSKYEWHVYSVLLSNIGRMRSHYCSQILIAYAHSFDLLPLGYPTNIPSHQVIPRMGWVLKVESHTDPWDGTRANIPSHPLSFRSVDRRTLPYFSLSSRAI